MEYIFWAVLAAVVAGFVLPRKSAILIPYFVAAILFSVFIYLIVRIPLSGNSPEVISITWSKSFGASFAFCLDGLAMVLLVLVTFIGAGVFLYAASYMRSLARPAGFYRILTIFTAAMIGLVLSDNMIVFFLFWETTSVCSFLLVGTKHQNSNARESARKALFVTVGGGLLLLVGFLMISAYGQSMGLEIEESLRFSLIERSIITAPIFPAVLVCIAMAIATKSAQIPFHFWLPSAMAGPTPVSSFLHSATMVKAGVFLLARLTPTLGGNEMWNSTFTTMGASTMLVGAVLSASQRDIKKILAYSTIAVLGILVMLFGIGTDVAVKAAVVFLVAHALYKAALFQIIGNIDYATGSRDLLTLGSLARVMPITAIAATLAALSMAGAPPLFGFFGKELAYLAKLQMTDGGLILILLAVTTNVLLVGLAISICFRPFWIRNNNDMSTIKKVPLPMVLVPLTLAVTGLFIGIFPALFDQYLGSQMASAVAGKSLTMKLKLWHGVNLESLFVLTLSVITLAIGIFVATKVKPIIAFFSTKITNVEKYGPDRWYEILITRIPNWSDNFISKIQSGDLAQYIGWTLKAALCLIAVPLISSVSSASNLHLHLNGIETVMCGVIALPAVAVLVIRSEIARLLLLGGSGFGIVLYFTLFGALDLALTQILVEALVLIFIIILLRSGWSNSVHNQEKRRVVPIAVALCFSLVVTLLLIIEIPEIANSAKSFYLENSYLKAFGKNVVNVILVDFRALDTFGEVLAIAIAALGSGALLLKVSRSKSNG